MMRVVEFLQRKLTLLAVILFVSLLMQANASHAYQSTQYPMKSLYSANQYVSLNQAVSMVQRKTGGRILSATTRQDGGVTFYLIKVLTPKGVVRVYRVDTQGNFR